VESVSGSCQALLAWLAERNRITNASFNMVGEQGSQRCTVAQSLLLVSTYIFSVVSPQASNPQMPEKKLGSTWLRFLLGLFQRITEICDPDFRRLKHRHSLEHYRGCVMALLSAIGAVSLAECCTCTGSWKMSELTMT